jgi:signal transduction histidine kinase
MPTAPLRRRPQGRVLAGVATGFAAYAGVPVVAVRLLRVALTLTQGVGLAVYAVFWVFLRQQDGPSVREDRRAFARMAALLVLLGVSMAVLGRLDLVPGGRTAPALLATVAGIAVVWHQADAAQRARWRSTATGARGGYLRVGAGALLLVAGLVGFLATRGELSNARTGLLSTIVVVGGLALLSSPWWVALTSDLREERTARIRSQERAEVAAHLHDSVLQTLALIQKASGSPAEVTRLARSQERELRHWLYAARDDEGTLASALEQAAVQVEDVLAVPVEVVVVGDCPLDDRVAALVAAAKEAVVNAAKHSGAPSVDVYAEVEPAQVSVFVRDRGRGFEPDAVPADRHGIVGSIVGRMERNSGTATVRSTPGQGTEVRLELPRA